MDDKTLAKHAGKTAFGTICSRVLGYLRDMLVANLFGVGMFADAFYAAFRIPNLFRRMFGEGSFSAAFIPVFSQYLHTKDKDETQKFLNAIFTVLFLILLILSALGICFSPILTKVIVWGFSDNPEKMQITIELTRLMFPFILFICLAAFLLAILNTLNSFFIPALAPASLSVSEIFYILSIAPLMSPESQIKGLALSVILGGALHFFIQYPKLKNLGWHLKFKIDLSHPGIKKVTLLMLPSLLGLSVDQINAFVDNICASFLGNGPVSALYYSNRLMQMPLAVFGLAFATASLPMMSKAYAKRDIITLKNSLNYSIRFTVFALMPAAVGLMVIGLPIVKLLFEHGKFNALGSIMTNKALFFYSLGLPGYAVSKIFANAFYSFEDTKTPVKTAVLAMILHTFLCIVLMKPMGVSGLALSTAASSYFNLIVLASYLKKRIGTIEVKRIIVSILKSFIASIFTGIVAWHACKVSTSLFLSVLFATFSGCIAFVTVSYILKSKELKSFFNIFSKK
jgi:putative peptidoglycan lipid II flippase